MEADWEIEVGGDAPVIDADWAGMLDLRRSAEKAGLLPEADQLPGLAEALMQLNAKSSPVRTSKCDVWISQEAFDADELDAPEGCAYAMACYIDLLPGGDLRWGEPAYAGEWCGRVCRELRRVTQRSCRVDLVVRSAVFSQHEEEPGARDYGVTAYIVAAGRDEAAARQTLSAAVAVFADSVAPPEAPANAAAKLQ
jgi:hypothetical protein